MVTRRTVSPESPVCLNRPAARGRLGVAGWARSWRSWRAWRARGRWKERTRRCCTLWSMCRHASEPARYTPRPDAADRGEFTFTASGSPSLLVFCSPVTSPWSHGLHSYLLMAPVVSFVRVSQSSSSSSSLVMKITDRQTVGGAGLGTDVLQIPQLCLCKRTSCTRSSKTSFSYWRSQMASARPDERTLCSSSR